MATFMYIRRQMDGYRAQLAHYLIFACRLVKF